MNLDRKGRQPIGRVQPGEVGFWKPVRHSHAVVSWRGWSPSREGWFDIRNENLRAMVLGRLDDGSILRSHGFSVLVVLHKEWRWPRRIDFRRQHRKKARIRRRFRRYWVDRRLVRCLRYFRWMLRLRCHRLGPGTRLHFPLVRRQNQPFPRLGFLRRSYRRSLLPLPLDLRHQHPLAEMPPFLLILNRKCKRTATAPAPIVNTWHRV
jgi:hypothetical protein